MNRTWITGEGDALCFSLVERTTLDAQHLPTVTMAAALGVDDFLREQDIASHPKWPNDVLVGGRKICGILAEHVSMPEPQKSALIIGIGLNVNQGPAALAVIDRPATSMHMQTNCVYTLERALDDLLPFIRRRIVQWKRSGFDAMRGEWTNRNVLTGKRVVIEEGGTICKGTALGFGRHGELWLQQENGITPIYSGDVHVAAAD